MSLDLRQFLVWVCNQAQVPPRQREAVVLTLIDGYSPAAIGAAMGFASKGGAHQASKLVRLGIKRLAVQEYEPYEVELWEKMLATVNEGETAHEHAVVLLEAVRNQQDMTPHSCEYDSSGRPIARRDPLVSVDQAELIVRRTPVRPVRAIYSAAAA